MRILFLGDIVGRSGRNAVMEALPGLRRRYGLDFVVINGENAAGGFGITEDIVNDLYDAGADAITLGNHSFDQREALVFIARHERLIRPLNYPEGTPGRGTGHFKAKSGAEVLVINAMGRIFMEALDCPFRAIEKELATCPLKKGADAVILDIHAEASSEKKAIAYHFDGEISLVVGTHTHVPTADDMILPGGTAYITDVGMCGDYDSIIGMEKEEAIQRFITRLPGGRFKPALGPGSISGIAVETDDKTGLARQISPLRLGGKLRPFEPDFWID